MKKLYNIFALALALLSCSVLSAQQDPMYSQYMFNTLAINPAYAGSADLLNVTALYRHQWTQFDGAPVTQTLTAHSPLGRESLGLGGTIVNDSYGPVQQTAFYADFSYRIIFDRTKLAFGLKAGASLFQADLLSLNPLDQDDPAFAGNIESKLLPNFGAGVMYYSDRFYVGLSVPKLFQNKLWDSSLPDFQDNTERMHGFLIAGMVFDINRYVKFKPSMLVRAVNGSPPSADLTANFLFYDKLWIGAMYRYEDAVGLLAQYEINNKIKIGYAYDYTISDLGRYNNGTHEIMLGVDFGRKYGGDKSPRYF